MFELIVQTEKYAYTSVTSLFNSFTSTDSIIQLFKDMRIHDFFWKNSVY